MNPDTTRARTEELPPAVAAALAQRQKTLFTSATTERLGIAAMFDALREV